MTKWLSEFTRQTWSFDDVTRRLGYACAYTNGQPQKITGHRGLIHSTEGSSWPIYQTGRVNPNFTVDPWKKARRQHVPSDVAARATMANNSMFVQIEIIGFCDLATATKYGMQAYYLERMGADELAYIAESLAIIGKANGIPTTTGVTWEAYPKSAWADNTVRLSQAQLNGYSGWLGHQHAPKPDIHGDPGVWPHTMNLMGAMHGNPPAPFTVHLPLTVDGSFGGQTMGRIEQVMGTPIDGFFTPGDSTAVRAVQTFLNDVGARDENGDPLEVDGDWDCDNTTHDTKPQHTTAALQRLLGTAIDKMFSYPDSSCVRALQAALNTATTGSKKFGPDPKP